MLTKNINFKNFYKKKKNSRIINIFKVLKNNFLKKKDRLLFSLSEKYTYSFNFNELKKYNKFKLLKFVGMGGSVLGINAIYSFLKFKIKKKVTFLDNLNLNKDDKFNKKQLNIIVSKSGNTLETISNLHTLNKSNKSIFITENKKNYLKQLANNLKSEIFEHKDYIGGRYSVLSETGMLPASLMGLNCKKFKRLNSLLRNKSFTNQLILNVSSILNLYQKGKTNSIILNYDEDSQDLFYWYQQLVAESLGKESKGILPVISLLPRDNHSLMQLYLDGTKNNFFTFFSVDEKKTKKIDKTNLLASHNYLKNKNTSHILKAQFNATQLVFKKRKIPFRTFVIKKRGEQTLGELFTFFILETILLGKAMKIDPFNQPEVELIKNQTNKILINY